MVSVFFTCIMYTFNTSFWYLIESIQEYFQTWKDHSQELPITTRWVEASAVESVGCNINFSATAEVTEHAIVALYSLDDETNM